MGRKRLYEEFFHYDDLDDTAHCYHCGKVLKRKDGSPTGMLRHAQKFHEDVYTAMLAIKAKEFEVEAVVDRRVQNGELQFLVKWANYGWDELTWEPEGHLANAQQTVDNFNATPAYFYAQYQAELLLLQMAQDP